MALVVSLPGQRPDPPEKLSDLEREVWRRIVATKPSEWFTPDSQPLLIEYCRAVIFADELAEALAKVVGVPEGDELDPWLRLRARQDQNARLLTTLATKMRLTQQSRWTAPSAATAQKNTAQDRKPWEFEASDAG